MSRSSVIALAAVLLMVPIVAHAVDDKALPTTAKKKLSGKRLVGTRRADHLIGTNRNDRIYGRRGNDTIEGRGGKDLLDGGPGNDRIIGTGMATVRGGSGDDSITLKVGGVHFHVDCGPGKHDRLSLVSAKTVSKASRHKRIRRCEMVVSSRPKKATPGTTGVPAPAPGAPAPRPPQPYLSVAALLARLPPATVFIAPNGSDGNPCTQAAPCQSMDRAYHVAQPGQVVEMAGGNYAGSFTADSSKTSPDDVYLRPAPGATVTANYLSFQRNRDDPSAAHLTIILVKTDGFSTVRGNDISFYGVDMTSFSIEGGSDISVVGGSVGGLNNGHPTISHWSGNNGASDMDRNILVDGVHFHDVTMQNASAHTECLQVNDGDGITVRNSIWTHCDTFNLFFSQDPGFGLNNVTVENNIFSTSTDSFGGNTYFSMRFGYAPVNNVLVRNNYSTQEMSFVDGGANSSWRISGNVGPTPTCGSAVASHNVWVGPSGCLANGGKRVANFAALKVDADARPAANSPLIDAGDPSSFTPFDITGVTRPLGAAPDAGPYEVG